MTTGQSVADFTQLARAAILAGNLDEAETYTKQAKALKSLDDLTPKVDTSVRPQFGATEPEETPISSATAMAVKSVYIKKFGEIDAASEQIYKELYGTSNYPMLRAMKMADCNRYLRTGAADPKLQKMVLLAPEQIMAAIVGGVPVSEGNYTIKATMIEAQDTLGGYLVIEEFNQDMVQRLPGLTVVRALASKYNTSRDALSFMVRTGGNKRSIGNVRNKMTSESPSAGSFDTNATFGKLIVPVHVNLAKVPVSKSLLEDSSMDVMGQVLMPEFQAEAALKEDTQFLTGSGSNEPQGILTGVAASGAPVNPDIVTQNSGATAAFTFDAFVAAPWKIAGQYRSKKPSTAWAFTSASGALIAGLKDGQGRYLWSEMNGNNAVGNPDTLRGWQYKESEALPEVAANTYPVIFGDFSGYRIVDRVGMSVERYSDSATADTDSVVFFCRRRYGGQVAEGFKFVVMQIATPLN